MVYKKVYEVREQTRKENRRGGERKQEEDGNNVTRLC